MAKKKRKKRGDEVIQKVRGVGLMKDSLLDGHDDEERKDKELMAFMNIFHPDKAPKNMYEARKMRQ